MKIDTQAYLYYNTHYNNATYQAVQVALVADLCSPYQASEPKLLDIALGTEPIHSLMVCLTDVCLEASGHPDLQGRCERLIRALVDAKVSAEVVRLMGQHIENFEEEGSTFGADFENTALALLCLRRLEIYPAKAHTSTIHSPVGNIANDLLCSADYALQLAKLVLMGESSSAYLHEKLRLAERHLQDVQKWLKTAP